MNKIILFILTVSLLFSCYEDKGNYTYHELNTIEISDIESEYKCQSSDVLTVEPKLEFSISENSNLKHEWLAQGEIIGTNKNLEIKISDLPKATSVWECKYIITDNNNGCKYSEYFKIMLRNKYNEGYVFLTQKDGKHDLAYIDIEIKTDDEDNFESLKYTPYENCYYNENGEYLPNSSLSLLQHFCSDRTVPGAIMVISEDGNIDTDGGSLVKFADTKEYFFDNKIPQDFAPVGEHYLDRYSYVLDKTGKIYTRELVDKQMLQSGRYNNVPFYIEGGYNISKIIKTSDYVGYFMMYDKKNRRFLFADKGEKTSWSEVNGNIKVIETNFENFSNLDNLGKNLVYSVMGDCTDWWTGNDFFSILEDAGRYYIHTFYSKQNYNMEYQIFDQDEYEFAYSNIIADDTQFCKFRLKDYLAISNNDKLYLYDTQNKTAPFLFYDFSGQKIIKIKRDRDKNNLLVLTDSGEFKVLKVTTQTLAGDQEKVVYSYNFENTTLKDVIYKYEFEYHYEYASQY